MKKTLTSFTIFTSAVTVHAVTLAHYEFTDSYADSINAAGITATDISRGTAMALNSNFSENTPVDGGTKSFFARGEALNQSVNSTSLALPSATTDGNYFEFTVSNVIGLNLSSLTLDLSKNAGNPNNMRILFTSDITGHTYADRLNITSPSGADSSLADVLQSEIANNLDNASAGDWGVGDNTSIDLSGAEFQGINSATFRVYAYAINASTGANNDILRFDNVILNGELVPEPSSTALLGLGGLALILRRRK